MRYMSLVRGKILSGEKNKRNIFLEQERTSEREEEELVKRQRCIKHLICSFNKYLLSVHHELETGDTGEQVKYSPEFMELSKSTKLPEEMK